MFLMDSCITDKKHNIVCPFFTSKMERSFGAYVRDKMCGNDKNIDIMWL